MVAFLPGAATGWYERLFGSIFKSDIARVVLAYIAGCGRLRHSVTLEADLVLVGDLVGTAPANRYAPHAAEPAGGKRRLRRGGRHCMGIVAVDASDMPRHERRLLLRIVYPRSILHGVRE